MAVAERTAYRRQLQRALRDYDVRRGVRTPGTIREVEIWRQGNAEREERLKKQIAEAERKQKQRTVRDK